MVAFENITNNFPLGYTHAFHKYVHIFIMLSLYRLLPITTTTFDFVNGFTFLRLAFTSKNNINLEIKHRITQYYYDLNRQLGCRDLYRTNKQMLYKLNTFRVLLNGVEVWLLLNTDAANLRVIERKVPHTIFEPL